MFSNFRKDFEDQAKFSKYFFEESQRYLQSD